MKDGLRGRQGSCAVVSALRVVAVSIRACRLGMGIAIILNMLVIFSSLLLGPCWCVGWPTLSTDMWLSQIITVGIWFTNMCQY